MEDSREMSKGLVIDYTLLGKAQEFYSKKGYHQIDIPPWASKEIIEITIPPIKYPDLMYRLDNTGKYLTGSAEQGFLYLVAKGLLHPGKYFSITPCFRYEPQDFSHRKCFMKCELFHLEPREKCALGLLKLDAEQFFKSLTDDTLVTVGSDDEPRECDIVGHVDILLNGLEIGSYGTRRHKGFTWIYGTGLAEPRFSLANRLSKG